MAVRRWGQHIGRLTRLWRLFAYMDFMWMTRDFRFFLTCYLSDIVLCIAAVTSSLLLAERFDGIGAFSKFEVIFMLGYVTIVKGLTEMLFGYNMLHISRRLGRGQLDHTLLQPHPVWVSILTEGFSPFSGSALLIPGLALLARAVDQLAIHVSADWIGALLINIGASSLLIVAFSYMWGSLAFWAPRAAEELSSPAVGMMHQLSVFPLDGIGAALSGILSTVVPAGLMAWYPSRYLLDIDSNPWGWAVTPLASATFGFIAMVLFRKGMIQYGRTGSQRYSTFGHRR